MAIATPSVFWRNWPPLERTLSLQKLWHAGPLRCGNQDSRGENFRSPFSTSMGTVSPSMCAASAMVRYPPQEGEVEGKGPLGYPINRAGKPKGESSISGTRVNAKVCSVTHRKSCSHGETWIG